MLRSNLLTTLSLAALAGAGACDGDDGIEPAAQATFEVTVTNVMPQYELAGTGVFDTAEGADQPGPIGPGDRFRFEFHAAPGHRLTFAAMFGQSNDFFYAPGEEGIPLYGVDDEPLSGDVTGQVDLWDAGTEVNQEPGLGEDQAPRQSGPDVGAADPDPTVRLAPDDYGNLPADEDVLAVTLDHLGGTRFALIIENVSNGSTLQTSDGGSSAAPVSPGVWVVHTDPAPLFTVGEEDRGMGLERIAEGGDVAPLADDLEPRAGVTTPLSPGVWAVHSVPAPFFENGLPDRGDGLERIAEDADPTALASSLGGAAGIESSGVFDTPDGADSPGPIFPEQSFTFTITAEEGDRLSLATMFGQSNDLFYGPGMAGIDLFSGGSPRSGDVSGEILLWDAGTEVNQAPGFGPDQAPRQSGPDTGAEEGGAVRPVSDGYTYPAPTDVIEVILTPTSG